MREPNELAKQFARELRFIRAQQKSDAAKTARAEKLHVSTTGAIITGLYENLRKASENAAENLTLTRAIKRFFKRFYLVPNAASQNAGEELIIELTLAGYLKNDSVSLNLIEEIDEIVHDYSLARKKLSAKFPREIVNRWTLEPMSAAIEKQLTDRRQNIAFTDFAYKYFLSSIDVAALFANRPIASYEAILFIAVQKVLLEADPASIRLNLIERYQISPLKTVDFAKINTQIDQIFAGQNLDKLSHIIDRHGASLRIVQKAMISDDHFDEHLASEKAFLSSFSAAVSASYKTVAKNINRGIVRSVVFLIITKFVIGVAIEVPYDIWIYGAAQWLPLTVNLALPPLYMIALRLTLLMPGANNTRALNREISRILFEPVPTKPFIGRRRGRKFGVGYNIVYVLAIVAVFAGVGWLLINFAHFEWIHLAIFFVFISTASFLGFRLSRAIREIEVGAETQNSVTMLRDLLYMPFVAVGRKINETYSKLNIVSHFLDMFVELPLKAILGSIRRWGNFISYKKDSF